MATIEQLSAALVKADAAGNTADAKAFADAIRQMQSATPELPESLRRRPVVSEGMPSDRQEQGRSSPFDLLTAPFEMGASLAAKPRQEQVQFISPAVEALGAAGGAVLGGGAGLLGGGPLGSAVGGVAGAGLGYGMAKEALNYLGGKAPRQGTAQITEPVKNIIEGATYEMGGRILAPLVAPLLAKGLGKVADLRQIPKNKAADIARNALGPDLPEALNALKSAQGKGVSAAQATADINSPTWQALIERATARDPRFLRALEQSQGEVSLNALSKLAGGATAAETRGAAEAAKKAVSNITTPMRETALNRANLGKAVADYEAQAGKLSAEAAAKVQEVRRLIDLGDHAAAAARLETIKMGMPASSRFAPAKSQAGFADEFAAKFTYPGKLAQMSDEWASQAANASLDLGQGARFAQGAADALRSVGIKPLEGQPLVRSLKTVANNPEFAGNDLLNGALKNVSDDITKWTSSGGVIDARALDAIRKNSVNATIAQLRPGLDAASQRNAAASVLNRIKPVIDDAIEAAGGVGYRDYLAQHAKLSQRVAEKQLTGEALNLWKTNKDSFVKLVQNESPEVVEKILGPGKYNIAKEVSDKTLDTLEAEAVKVIRNASVKSQVAEGQTALKELLLQNLSKFRLPSYLNAMTSTTNKALNILENKIGVKTMSTLTDALKTPESAASLLESLPANERARVLKLIADPGKWTSNVRSTISGATAGAVNMLAPEFENQNALAGQ